MKYLLGKLITLNLILVLSVAHATAFNFKTPTQPVSRSHVKMYYFKQQIDHANPASPYFAQRYYINDAFVDPNRVSVAPVFFVICGETTCTPADLSGYAKTLAQRYHGILVALEHRYYGMSLPFDNLATENLKYLTVNQVLQDMAAFERHMISFNGWRGKWVAIGGSYSGMLAAFYRSHYPSLVAGAIASSAPVHAKATFEEYDAYTAKVIGDDCRNNAMHAVTSIEQSMVDPNRMADIKKMFSADDIIDNTDFLDYISSITAMTVQYGQAGVMCSLLGAGGNPLDGLANLAYMINQQTGIKPVVFTAQGAESENPADYQIVGSRQFYYQACTEFGFWPVASLDRAQSTKSSLLDGVFYQAICKRLFNMDQPANIDATNKEYYAPLLDPNKTSHIVFTNGSADAWSQLSLSVENGNASNPTLTYITIPNASHAADLNTPSDQDSFELKMARQKIEIQIQDWINE